MDINYVFGDLKSNEIIEEIPMFGVSMSGVLNNYGELRGSYQLDMTGKNNLDLKAASIPGRCFAIAEIDNEPIWGGIVWSRTYQATSKTLQLYCKSFEAYPSKRFVRTDYAFQDDQTSLFIYYWQQLQDTDGNILVEVPSNIYSIPTGVSKTSVVKANEYKTYEQIMRALADGSNGFDWTIDVVKSGGVYRRILRIGYPIIGAPASDNSVTLEYPGSITNYWATESIASSGTHIDVLGGGEGESMIKKQVVHNDLLSTGWVKWDVDVSYKDVTSQNTLDGLAAQEAINRRPPSTVVKVEVKADLDPVFGSYVKGDYMHVNIDDPRFSKLSEYKRLIRWEFWPKSSDGSARANLTFEGDE